MEKESFNELVIKARFASCMTAQELAAARENLIEGSNRAEAESVERTRREGFERRCAIRGLSAKRLAEIKEANRQQWKQDRIGMWEEAANTCTPQTIAAILHAATQRGIIESYTVNVAVGEVLKGGRRLSESEVKQ